MCVTFIFDSISLIYPWEHNEEENHVELILLSPETGIYVNKLVWTDVYQAYRRKRYVIIGFYCGFQLANVKFLPDRNKELAYFLYYTEKENEIKGEEIYSQNKKE